MSSDTSATTDPSSIHETNPSVPKHRSRPSEAEMIVGQILQQQQQQPSSSADIFAQAMEANNNNNNNNKNNMKMNTTNPVNTTNTGPPLATAQTTMRGLLQQASQARLSNLNNTNNANSTMANRPSPPVAAAPSPTLGETTAYLQTLHEEHNNNNSTASSSTRNPSAESFVNEHSPADNNNNNPDGTLSHEPSDFEAASPMDRLTMMGSVLKAAAKLKQPILVEQKESSSNMEEEVEISTPPVGSNANTAGTRDATDIEAPTTQSTTTANTTKKTKKKKHMGQRIHKAFRALPSAAGKTVRKAYNNSAQEWTSLAAFFKPQSASFATLVFRFCVFGLIPFGGVAAYLFYEADNPPVRVIMNDHGVVKESYHDPCLLAGWPVLT